MRVWLIMLSISLAFLPLSARAATYYVSSLACNSNASDSNPGTSQTAPLATCGGAANVPSGSTVLFQTGCSSTNDECNFANDNITVDEYGNPTMPWYQVNGTGSALAMFWNSRANATYNHINIENNGFTACEIGAFFKNLVNPSMNNMKCGVTGTNSSANAILFEADGFNVSNISMNNVEATDPGGGNAVAMEQLGGGQFQVATILNSNFHDAGGACLQVFADSQANVVGNNSFPYGFDVEGSFYNCATNGAISYNAGMLSWPVPSAIRNFAIRNIGSLSAPNVNALQIQYAPYITVENGSVDGVFTSVPDGDCVTLDYAWRDPNYKTDHPTVRHLTVSHCGSSQFSAGVDAVQATNARVYDVYSSHNGSGFRVSNSTSTGNSFIHVTADSNVNNFDFDQGAPVATVQYSTNTNASQYAMRVANSSTAPNESVNDNFNNAGGIVNTDSGTTIPFSGTDLAVDPKYVSSTNYALQPSSPLLGAATGSPSPDIGSSFYFPTR